MAEETQPATVPRAKQAGEIRARWAWTESSVWTDRMLTALEVGVKGGNWFSLIDKVAAKRNLEAATRRVVAKKGRSGVDRVTVAQFRKHSEREIEKLRKDLLAGTYRPQAILRIFIPKPGTKEKRPLGIPTVRDRVVQTALRNVLEPIYENTFAEHSYGFRPKRGCQDALRRVNELASAGHTWIVDADLKSYFDTIPPERLMELVRERVADGAVLKLIESFLSQPVFEGLAQWTPTQGTPQGAVISPLLANLYLNGLDHLMAQSGHEMVRYADDFVVLCRTQHEAQEALERIKAWTDKAGLTLHPTKTKVLELDGDNGFDFLGYHFRRSKAKPTKINRWPRHKGLKRLRETLRRPTRRNSGESLQCIITRINRVLRGWFGYFKHSTVRTDFDKIDGWVRMRLRSLLRRRRKRKGRARGRDHQRWPNAYFAEQGLFSLVAAHADACQSSRR